MNLCLENPTSRLTLVSCTQLMLSSAFFNTAVGRKSEDVSRSGNGRFGWVIDQVKFEISVGSCARVLARWRTSASLPVTIFMRNDGGRTGVILLCSQRRVDYREKPGYILCTIAVIAVLKNMARKGHIQHCKTDPTGLLHLNALRLADVFSDDSNLRSYITAYFAEVLAIMLALPYQEFSSYWCSSDLPTKEVDATLNFDPFATSGWTFSLVSSLEMTNVEYSEPTFQPTNVPQAYAHQRTSLLVKIIANLHCFIPKICEEQERNFFLHKFLESLQMQFPNSGTDFASIADAQLAATVGKNLHKFPVFLNANIS